MLVVMSTLVGTFPGSFAVGREDKYHKVETVHGMVASVYRGIPEEDCTVR